MIADRAFDLVPDVEPAARGVVIALLDHRGLSPERERDLRLVASRVLVSVLRATDSLAAKTAELEACEARGDRHLRTCPTCLAARRGTCATFRALERRIEHLERACAHETAKLERRAR